MSQYDKWKLVRIPESTHSKIKAHLKYGESMGRAIEKLVNNHEDEIEQ